MISGLLGAISQPQQSQAAFAQQCRYEAEHRAQYRTPEQQMHALAEARAEAHEREQRDLRNLIRGRTWKCGPWAWET